MAPDPSPRAPIPIAQGDKIAAALEPLPLELLPPRCIPHETLGDICYRLEDDSWRWIAGEERGKELYPSQVSQLLRQHLKEVQAQKVDQLVQDAIANPDTKLRDFAAGAIALMVSAHVMAATLPHGGRGNMGQKDWDRVQATAMHYVNAPSTRGDDKRYGLRWLLADLKAGKLSPKMLAHRVKGYVNSAIVSFWREVRADAMGQERLYAFRTLGKKKHCQSCIDYYKLGIRPADQIPLPATFCLCGPNCDCSIYYISALEKAKIEEGIKSGRAYSLGGVPWGGVSG
jgi:hypothetical protein